MANDYTEDESQDIFNQPVTSQPTVESYDDDSIVHLEDM